MGAAANAIPEVRADEGWRATRYQRTWRGLVLSVSLGSEDHWYWFVYVPDREGGGGLQTIAQGDSSSLEAAFGAAMAAAIEGR